MTCPACQGHGEVTVEAFDAHGPGISEMVGEDCPANCREGQSVCRQCDEAAVGVSTTSRKALCTLCLAEELIAADMRRVGLVGQVVAPPCAMPRRR